MKYFTLLILIFSLQTQATSIRRAPKLIARQIEKKLKMIEDNFNDNSAFQTPIVYKNGDETGYYLKRIRLQFTPFAAFELPLLEVKVLPMIEFRWIRKNPKGWVNYKKPLS